MWAGEKNWTELIAQQIYSYPIILFDSLIPTGTI